MRFAFSFCCVAFVFLCYFVRTNSARPALGVEDERKSKEHTSYIVEVDPYASEVVAKEQDRKKPVNFVTAEVRNKRHFDLSDYLSSSSEENNSFGYLPPKPQNNPYGFAYFWKYYRPPTHAGYQSWQPAPTAFYTQVEFNRRPHHQPHNFNYHHHHHSNEDCKYPFSDSNEYEYGDSGEISGGSTTEIPVRNGSETPVTPPTTTTTTSTTTATTTTTTTTEYVPIIDIRSAH